MKVHRIVKQVNHIFKKRHHSKKDTPCESSRHVDEENEVSAVAPGHSRCVMEVEEVFTPEGEGMYGSVCIAGMIKYGFIKIEEDVEILANDTKDILKAKVRAIEQDRKLLDLAEADDEVVLLLGGIRNNNIQRNDVLWIR